MYSNFLPFFFHTFVYQSPAPVDQLSERGKLQRQEQEHRSRGSPVKKSVLKLSGENRIPFNEKGEEVDWEWGELCWEMA